MQRELDTEGSTLTFFASVGLWQPDDGHRCGEDELFVHLEGYLPPQCGHRFRQQSEMAALGSRGEDRAFKTLGMNGWDPFDLRVEAEGFQRWPSDPCCARTAKSPPEPGKIRDGHRNRRLLTNC
jgi:hypothetical protein